MRLRLKTNKLFCALAKRQRHDVGHLDLFYEVLSLSAGFKYIADRKLKGAAQRIATLHLACQNYFLLTEEFTTVGRPHNSIKPTAEAWLNRSSLSMLLAFHCIMNLVIYVLLQSHDL